MKINEISYYFKIIAVCISLITGFIFVSCTSTKPIVEKIGIEKEIELNGKIRFIYDENGKRHKSKTIRSKIDTLEKTQVDQLNSFFNKLNPDYPSVTEFIFISYFPGDDPCNTFNIEARKEAAKKKPYILPEIEKRSYLSSAFIYADKKGKEQFNENTFWNSDENKLVENTFFKEHYPCSSYTILHKSGIYYSYYGESMPEKKMLDMDLFKEFVNR